MQKTAFPVSAQNSQGLLTLLKSLAFRKFLLHDHTQDKHWRHNRQECCYIPPMVGGGAQIM